MERGEKKGGASENLGFGFFFFFVEFLIGRVGGKFKREGT